MTDLFSIALFNWNLFNAVRQRKVNARHWQSNEEWHLIIKRSQRLQIGTNLIADVTGNGSSIATNNTAVY